jgi:hypothetical protein
MDSMAPKPLGFSLFELDTTEGKLKTRPKLKREADEPSRRPSNSKLRTSTNVFHSRCLLNIGPHRGKNDDLEQTETREAYQEPFKEVKRPTRRLQIRFPVPSLRVRLGLQAALGVGLQAALVFQAAPLRLHPETLFCALHKGGSLLAVLKANLRLVLKAA